MTRTELHLTFSLLCNGKIITRKSFMIILIFTFPSAEIVLSEILPRSQNLFRSCSLSLDFLERWNNDAADVNRRIRGLGTEVDWIHAVQQTDFYSIFGM